MKIIETIDRLQTPCSPARENLAGISLALWIFLLGSACPPGRAAESADIALPILDHEQLFLDNYAIEKMENITRRLNAVAKREKPVMETEKPGNYIRPVGLIHDEEDGLFKMWYLTYSGAKKIYATAYATSKDGISWDKPALGLKDNSKTGAGNNWVMWGTVATGPQAEPDGPYGKFCFGCTVIKEPQEKDPTRRYKAMNLDRVYEKGSLITGVSAEIMRSYSAGIAKNPDALVMIKGHSTAVSPDGIHWTVEKAYATRSSQDLGHLLVEPWDKSPTGKRYVFFGRTSVGYQDTIGGDWVKWSAARAVNRLESTDFVNWKNDGTVLAADTQDQPGTQIYSMAVFPYEGLYIALVNLYNETSGHMFVQLAVSRNTYRFSRVEPRASFIPRGANGSWDFGCIVVDRGPLIVGDEMRFYYGGQRNRHDGRTGWRQRVKESTTEDKACAIGMGSIKRGRFLALEAGAKEGLMLTRPVCIEGRDLSINANAARGKIQVTLLDDSGRPIPGYETTVQGVDGVSVPVTFGKGALEPLRNMAIRIQFRMTNAQLYGFRVSGGAKPVPFLSGRY